MSYKRALCHLVRGASRVRGLIYNIYWQSADGTGQAERLTESKNHQFPNAWHPNEQVLVFNEIIAQGTNRDLMILKMEGNETSGWKPGKPTVYLSTPFIETNCALSPDGAWLAYESNESGQSEVWSPGHFTTGLFQRYDLHPGGDRFAISTSPQNQTEAAPGKVIFVFNFFDQLKRIASNPK